MLRHIAGWGWYPALITALAVFGLVFGWPVEIIVPALILILAIGLMVAAIGSRNRELEMSSLRLRQLAGYFQRRFAGNSSLSIFAIIGGLVNTDNPRVWEWVRACEMSGRIFNTWCDSYVSRVENDVKAGKFPVYMFTYLNELWDMNGHYYEFVEQFQELAGSVDIPRETGEQYNKFVTEYNAFVQDFRDNISTLKKIARSGIEPPSVKLAKELSPVRQT
ncbi:MAG: hypothetical protein HYX91_00575 [Chloroflexi bacterium]|nr:hypothetical protein [Chloroflexota bacterium]